MNPLGCHSKGKSSLAMHIILPTTTMDEAHAKVLDEHVYKFQKLEFILFINMQIHSSSGLVVGYMI